MREPATAGERRDPAAHRPQPVPDLPPMPGAQDVDFPGLIALAVDATDVTRRILQVRERLPVAEAGPLVLLYPKWLPGFHAPQAPVKLMAGLVIEANGASLPWRRDSVTVNAFRVEVPAGVDVLDIRFQFVSPTAPDQGRVIVTPDLLCLPWNTVLLYPAGHYARRIRIEAALTLPAGWHAATALDQVEQVGQTRRFAPVTLDTLVDSPVFAGPHHRRVPLDDTVDLHLFGEEAQAIDPTPAQVAPHRALVVQADRLFGQRPFKRFAMLLALSGELTPDGVEHHASFEAVSVPDYLTSWDTTWPHRDTVAHEFIHAWNGKHARGADSWSPDFEQPIRNSLLWVYEGQTQYWTNVLSARAGLWTAEQALGAFAVAGARFEARPGRRWRPTIDTTRDPVVAARAPLPWPSWQRSEDYYGEGGLIWLDVDMRLRMLSDGRASLDDFARTFFAAEDAAEPTRLYSFADVVQTLQALAPFEWASLLERHLTEVPGPSLADGLARGGYRLDFAGAPNAYQAAVDAGAGQLDLTHTLGLVVGGDGTLSQVVWEGAAFDAGLTVGDRIVTVEGRAFALDALRAAIAAAAGGRVTLDVTKARRHWSVAVACPAEGLRYPVLERIAGVPALLDAALAAR